MNPHPFPHVVADGLWDADLLRSVLEEFPESDDPRWRRYGNDRERKCEGGPALWGSATRLLFQTFERHASAIGATFGFDDLTMETVGGGYHLVEPGGYLGVHTDFSRSPVSGRYRVVNLLVFLNDRWLERGGELELWGVPKVFVAPEFNRSVMFATSSSSWHGHPTPATRTRRSVAAYFFSARQPEGFAEQSTVFHPEGADACESR